MAKEVGRRVTLRLTEREAEQLEKVREKFRFTTDTAAIIGSLNGFPDLKARYEQLERKYQALLEKHNKMIRTIQEYQDVQRVLFDMTKMKKSPVT